MAQWFVLRNETVRGPFSTEEVKALSSQGQILENDLIWGRAQKEWRAVNWWIVELPRLLERTVESKDSRLWHYAVHGTAYGPFTRDDLIRELRDLQSQSPGELLLVLVDGLVLERGDHESLGPDL